MDWLKQRLREWLFPLEVLSLKQSVQDQERLHNLLQCFSASGDVPRITLEDLQMSPTEKIVLKSCDSQFRHALWKSGEHLCLTSVPECCRKTAVRYREYQRALTASEKNKLPFDTSPLEKAEEKTKQYFTPHAVS